MKNETMIRDLIEKRLLNMADGNEHQGREIWKQSQGSDLDAFALKNKIFDEIDFCMKCGKSLQFKATRNGIPQCLMPCEIN